MHWQLEDPVEHSLDIREEQNLIAAVSEMLASNEFASRQRAHSS